MRSHQALHAQPLDSPASSREYITSPEALQLLGIRQQTLYAYVSRGLIRSVAQPSNKHRLYLLDDVRRVAAKSAARSGHGAVAASAMNWGEPIITSLVTEIRVDGPSYRGHAASALRASQVGFEAVAELLWTGELPARPVRWKLASSEHEFAQAPSTSVPMTSATLLESFADIVLQLGLSRGSVEARVKRGQALAAARQLMQTLVACCGLASDAGMVQPMKPGDTIAAGLARSLRIEPSSANLHALEAILVLLADHELSPGTTSARVVASGGASLHACIAAALCASSGVEVGRSYDYVEELLGQARSSSALTKRALRLLQSGHAVPGFQHPLYPKGDPRALDLLAIAAARSDQTPQSRAALEFVDAMRVQANLFPRQEIGVVLLSRMMGLRAPAPTALFVISRLAGWVAHVLEQRERGTLLRPRARFATSR